LSRVPGRFPLHGTQQWVFNESLEENHPLTSPHPEIEARLHHSISSQDVHNARNHQKGGNQPEVKPKSCRISQLQHSKTSYYTHKDRKQHLLETRGKHRTSPQSSTTGSLTESRRQSYKESGELREQFEELREAQTRR
jgi:hypothetical protein